MRRSLVQFLIVLVLCGVSASVLSRPDQPGPVPDGSATPAAPKAPLHKITIYNLSLGMTRPEVEAKCGKPKGEHEAIRHVFYGLDDVGFADITYDEADKVVGLSGQPIGIDGVCFGYETVERPFRENLRLLEEILGPPDPDSTEQRGIYREHSLTVSQVCHGFVGDLGNSHRIWLKN